MQTDRRDEPFESMPFTEHRLPASNGGRADADAISRETSILTSFLRRFTAYAIDSMLLSVIFLSGIYALYLVVNLTVLIWVGIVICVITAGFLYYWLNEAWFGATVGKWALRVRVVNKEGQPPGLRKSLIRNLIRIAEFSPFMLNGFAAGILVMAVPSKQRLGDMAAGTYVLPVRNTLPPSARRSTAMRRLFVSISIVGAAGTIAAAATVNQWTQVFWSEQTFQTTDGRYEITVPGHWDRRRDVENGLFINSYISNAFVYMDGATDEEMSEYPAVQAFGDYVRGWIVGQYSAVLDDAAFTRMDLNGNPAYRFRMHGIDEDGTWKSYTVTVTGDGDRNYFIVSSLYDTNRRFSNIEEFWQQHAEDLDKLNGWVGSFKPAAVE
ncbi:RDD family protein [Paenibacillus kobensis]|uniref:RDD family protein n=1 Tax=Paenibacillus kobensis TaxID=59841 RepID=UPI0013E3D1F3|nr:RDD family protein [Paenibacillus kobensis]